MQCRSCKFFQPQLTSRGGYKNLCDEGHCRRYPTAVRVLANHWCGEFAYLKPVKIK